MYVTGKYARMGKQRIIVILSMNREGKKEARSMARTVAIVGQDFEKLIQNDYFYIDKTEFIKEWWESGTV